LSPLPQPGREPSSPEEVGGGVDCGGGCVVGVDVGGGDVGGGEADCWTGALTGAGCCAGGVAVGAGGSGDGFGDGFGEGFGEGFGVVTGGLLDGCCAGEDVCRGGADVVCVEINADDVELTRARPVVRRARCDTAGLLLAAGCGTMRTTGGVAGCWTMRGASATRASSGELDSKAARQR